MQIRRVQDLMLGAFGGVLLFFLLFDKTAENLRLQAERDSGRKKLEDVTASRPRVNRFVRQEKKESFSSMQSGPSLSLGAPQSDAAVTDEDKGLLDQLEERRTRGEYVNELEDPIRRRSMKESITKGAEMLAPANRTNLAPLFAQFGMDPDKTELLLQHVSKINEAAIEVGQTIQQLEKARSDYDKKIRSLLSPDDYNQYKQHEAAGAAREEFEKLSHFALEKGRIPPQDEREKIIAILQAAEAYPQQSYLGPYDGLPNFAVGREHVLGLLERQLAEVNDGGNQALQLLSEGGFPEEITKLVSDYYTEEIRKRSDEVAQLQDPDFEKKMQEAAERTRIELVKRAEKEAVRR
jgi:hypothetical protein